MQPLEIEVMSLNVWGLPWPLARDRARRFRRIRRLFEDGPRELVGFQELWGRSHRALGLESLRRPRGRRDSGLALGGSLASGAHLELHHFRRAAGPDRLKAKGALVARVPLEGGAQLRVIVTHLQAGRRNAVLRAHQIDELVELAAPGDEPTVLLGDFNLYAGLPEDERSAARLADAGYPDAHAPDGARRATFEPANPYVPRRHPPERFDRILVRSGRDLALTPRAAGLVEGGGALSDHHAPWLRLRIAPR